MQIKHIALAFGMVLSVAVGFVRAQEVVFHPNWTAHVSWNVAEVGVRVPIEAGVVKGAPYSADVVTESVHTLADGNRIVQGSSARVYRDSEGRIRREEGRTSGSPAISITDPVAGVAFSLDTENQIAYQTATSEANKVSVALKAFHDMKIPAGVAEKIDAVTVEQAKQRSVLQLRALNTKLAEIQANGSAERVVVEKLPARNIEGVRAEGVRRTTTIEAGAIGNDLPIEIVSEEWFSTDLRMLVLTERRDPRVGTSTYRVTNIVRAEPDRYLFEVPANYTVQQTGVFRKPLVVRPQK